MVYGSVVLGDVFSDKNGTCPIPLSEDISGYYFIEDRNLPIGGSYSSKITLPDGSTTTGKYVHRMVVFSFGDCHGRMYAERGYYDTVDHIDMNHKNNSVDNLELVSYGINLYRAYVKTNIGDCYARFMAYYSSLDPFKQFHLQEEIKMEIGGRYGK